MEKKTNKLPPPLLLVLTFMLQCT